MNRLRTCFLGVVLAAVAAPALAQEATPAPQGSRPFPDNILQQVEPGEFIGLCAVVGGVATGALAVLLFGGAALIQTLRGDLPNAQVVSEQLDALHERLDRIESRLGGEPPVA